MKNKIFIIGLLLILVYCLSAVCAADLNQTSDDFKVKDNDDIKVVSVNNASIKGDNSKVLKINGEGGYAPEIPNPHGPLQPPLPVGPHPKPVGLKDNQKVIFKDKDVKSIRSVFNDSLDNNTSPTIIKPVFKKIPIFIKPIYKNVTHDTNNSFHPFIAGKNVCVKLDKCNDTNKTVNKNVVTKAIKDVFNKVVKDFKKIMILLMMKAIAKKVADDLEKSKGRYLTWV